MTVPRCIPLSTRNQSNARTAVNIVIVIPMTMTGREPVHVAFVLARDHRVRDLLYESNSTCIPVQSRYRDAISLDDHAASTIFCLPCDVIDYCTPENAPRRVLIVSIAVGGNDFHLSYRVAD